MKLRYKVSLKLKNSIHSFQIKKRYQITKSRLKEIFEEKKGFCGNQIKFTEIDEFMYQRPEKISVRFETGFS